MDFNASYTNTGPPTQGIPIPIQLPSLDGSFGALFIGMCFCILLYGLTLHQTYRYFRLYPQDRKWLKYMVSCILIAETLHTVLTIHICYYHLVTNYFNPSSLADVTWSLILLAPVSLVTISFCQGFYIRRIYMVSTQYRVVAIFAIVLLITEFGFIIYLTALEGIDPSLKTIGKLRWIVSAIYGIAFSLDSMVTGVLITVLLKSRTGSKPTESMVQTLIVYTINSGLVTSIGGTLTFIFALVLSADSMVYIAMGVAATKLYANSVLAVLNTRRSLSEHTMDGFTTDTTANGSGAGDLPRRPTVSMSSVAFASAAEHSIAHPVTISLPPLGVYGDDVRATTMTEVTEEEKV